MGKWLRDVCSRFSHSRIFNHDGNPRTSKLDPLPGDFHLVGTLADTTQPFAWHGTISNCLIVSRFPPATPDQAGDCRKK